MRSAEHLKRFLKQYRFSLEDEKRTQREIEQALIEGQFNYKREYFLSKDSQIDFMVGETIGVEVKLKGSPSAILEQLKRYCQFEKVEAIVLVTNKAMRLPLDINNKSTYIVNIGATWL